jgi:signal peptidase I
MVRRILKWALVASCVLSVAGTALVIAATLHTTTSQESYLRITGGSMEPTIAKGEVIGVDPTLAIGVGSVITFAKDGKTTTHRVVKKWQSHDSSGTQRTVYQTKGDANTTDDPWVVTDNEVIGVLTSTPLLIRLALPLIDNPFLAAMFALPLLAMLFLGEIYSLLTLLERHLSRKPSAQISGEKRFKIAF